MKETILETLKNLNFTEYEAKAYLTLLEESPLTGYAAAKKIPVYRVQKYMKFWIISQQEEIFWLVLGTHHCIHLFLQRS